MVVQPFDEFQVAYYNCFYYYKKKVMKIIMPLHLFNVIQLYVT
jgi:hypothetical protein